MLFLLTDEAHEPDSVLPPAAKAASGTLRQNVLELTSGPVPSVGDTT